jgi:hypothetical protein
VLTTRVGIPIDIKLDPPFVEYSYRVIALPPLYVGGRNTIVMELTPETTSNKDGLSGVVKGITEMAFEPATDNPFLFSFFTRTEYVFPFVTFVVIVYVVDALPIDVYVFPLSIE